MGKKTVAIGIMPRRAQVIAVLELDNSLFQDERTIGVRPTFTVERSQVKAVINPHVQLVGKLVRLVGDNPFKYTCHKCGGSKEELEVWDLIEIKLPR